MTSRTVAVSEGRGLARSIAVGTHILTADEPRPISGDTGPTPGELLLAALGACTSMAVRASADRHDWPLDQVDVTVQFDAHGRITKEVRLTGELDPDHIKGLVSVAERCPVHRLLAEQTPIVTVPTVVTPRPAE
ncbi:OsmC family protein [Streptomyces sp. HPF1205]|uniref:OsmC family protein n=1 Tax=Streptomyces sp. HPF1205 TaxID=2873262 RepID=UPI001CEE04D8|nr:OsmC family protein [Streptomyces sp. HPF1205]